jgi:hypothetical protein
MRGFRALTGALVCFAFTTASCSSDPETGFPDTPPKISITALSAEIPEREIGVSEARLALQTLLFVPCDPQSAKLGTRDFRINLLVYPPSSLTLDSFVTDYCRIEADLAPPSTEMPTAHLVGTRADGTRFELTSRQTLALDLDSVPAGQPFNPTKLVLGADLAAWLADVELDDAEATDDTVLIDADHNSELLETFEATTVDALSLYFDANDDGLLTDDEVVPVAGAAVR